MVVDKFIEVGIILGCIKILKGFDEDVNGR